MMCHRSGLRPISTSGLGRIVVSSMRRDPFAARENCDFYFNLLGNAPERRAAGNLRPRLLFRNYRFTGRQQWGNLAAGPDPDDCRAGEATPARGPSRNGGAGRGRALQ